MLGQRRLLARAQAARDLENVVALGQAAQRIQRRQQISREATAARAGFDHARG